MRKYPEKQYKKFPRHTCIQFHYHKNNSKTRVFNFIHHRNHSKTHTCIQISFTTKIILKHTHVFSFFHHKNHSKTHTCIQFSSSQKSFYHEVSWDFQGVLSTDIIVTPESEQRFSQIAERAPQNLQFPTHFYSPSEKDFHAL